jgi:hypothetical protein
MSSFIKIRPVGAEIFMRAGRQKDGHDEVKVDYRNLRTRLKIGCLTDQNSSLRHDTLIIGSWE